MALAALLVSGLALLTSWFAIWRQVHLAKRVEERATLSVKIEPVGTSSNMLVVRNDGPATAYDVTIDLTPRAPGEAPGLLNSPFPAIVAARSEASAILSESLATATQLMGTLKWTDDAGSHEEHLYLVIR
jgi:hypothetical protein